jgi:hypothetical protein
MDENQQLKRNGGSSSFVQEANSVTVEKLPREKKDLNSLRNKRKENTNQAIQDFNEKILSDLQGQIEDMFNAAAAKKDKKLKNKQEGEEDGET